MFRKGCLSWLRTALGRRRRRRVEDVVALVARSVDRPDPPRRYTFSCGYGPGMRGRTDETMRAVKAFMAGQPYELVDEVLGSEADLLASGAIDEAQLGHPIDPRARFGRLRYERRD